MLDLTGGNLVAYLLRILRDAVERHPRFKNTLGNVTFPSNTHIRWGDVQIIIQSVTTSGNRLSFDYFMCTQIGRAILAKVTDKSGQFVEWVREIDPTHLTPDPGVYYLNVDFFNDQTRELGLTGQKFKWVEGRITNAVGSVVYFRPSIDVTTLAMYDGPVFSGTTAVQFKGFNQSLGSFAYLLSPVTNLSVLQSGTPLVPFTDYWYQRPLTTVICQTTLGGSEILSIPNPYISINFTDQNGYVLRPNSDYTFYANGFIKLASYSPPGSTIYANAIVQADPSQVVGTNSENIFQIGLQPGENLAADQVFIQSTAGNFNNVPVNTDGTITLPTLLQPGECATWEARIETPQVKLRAKKWELNSMTIVDPTTITYAKPNATGDLQAITNAWVQSADPTELKGVVQTSAGTAALANGAEQYFLPGLQCAIGDQVVVGDQVAILVSPTATETYEVYGSKENLTFNLEVKANDLQTASDLSEMLKQQMLIMGRENAEADGLTIFEVTRSFQGQARDLSGTAPAYVYTIGVTASADWKVFVPKITRLVKYEIINNPVESNFQGKIQMVNRVAVFGSTQFVTSYA